MARRPRRPAAVVFAGTGYNPPLGRDGRRMDLETSVRYLKGIGPRRAEELAKHGITTLRDLLEYPPFRYEDRTALRPIATVQPGEWALVGVEVRAMRDFATRR